ncbi:c14.1 [Ichnoviriform fugitivi]|uniref:C14.1 n=1 Tax=Ichnoviriform fugitivi TaxID=265522 RepID=A2Q0H8_9VIRU|nr:c14.1 [Ichnoviriform fugitivi]BAF45693.1 c14.1 [Ichnoviriform fugitivi]
MYREVYLMLNTCVQYTHTSCTHVTYTYIQPSNYPTSQTCICLMNKSITLSSTETWRNVTADVVYAYPEHSRRLAYSANFLIVTLCAMPQLLHRHAPPTRACRVSTVARKTVFAASLTRAKYLPCQAYTVLTLSLTLLR